MRIRDERGLTFIHPFDDLQLIAGQGTVGLEILEDAPDAHTVVVPIGGGGLISGIAAAINGRQPEVRVVGVESTGAAAMTLSVERGELITLDENRCTIDGLKVMRVGEKTFSIVSELVDQLVTIDDERIFDAVLWTMSRCKLVVEGAAAAPVAALLEGRIEAEPGSKVVCVLSGGNLDLEHLRGRVLN
jgi:threonine dehydratase